MRWSAGDRIRSKESPHVVREITEVRATGYTWVYRDEDGQNPHGCDYVSENSTDPQMEACERA